MQGGHLVHSHYYADAAELDGFAARISFSMSPQQQQDAAEQITELWPNRSGSWAARWDPSARDILFLAGQDWRYLLDQRLDELSNPRINLIQHVRHAEPDTALHSYLSYRAVRICVSEEVAQKICRVPQLNGPVITIANGCDLPVLESQAQKRPTASMITIFGYKNPELARALAELLARKNICCSLLDRFVPRSEFIREMSECDIAVCIPRHEEGFYLPALEAMSLGCLVVTADCIGNQSFCQHEHNCLIAEFTPEAFLTQTIRARSLSAADRSQFLSAARVTAESHSLASQRRQFHDLLKNIDQLW